MSVVESETVGGDAPVGEAADRTGLASPFAGAHVTEGGGPTAADGLAAARLSSLSTPFAEGFTTAGEMDEEVEAFQALVAELEDEGFDEALEALEDEAAARHLTAAATWSSESEAPVLAAGEVESWLSSVASEADRVLEQLERSFGDRMPESLAEGEVEAAAGYGQGEVGPDGPTSATEEFIKSLVKKAGNLAKGAVKLAKKGLQTIAKFLPVGRLFALLRRLVPALLRRVLRKATGRLPAPLRPMAATLSAKLAGKVTAAGAPRGTDGGTDGGEGAEEAYGASPADAFDARLAEAVLAPSEEGAEQVVSEAAADGEAAGEGGDPVAALDSARSRLAGQLAEAIPGEAPVEQVQQFIPAVMAALPLIRLGVRAVGREKVVNFVGDRLAALIKDHVGPEAARALARPIASTGLSMLGLEAEAGTADSLLGTEALVATVEDTVREVVSLPAESLAEQLRLEAEIQQAFSEAVARHLPREVLRDDLPTLETAGEGGVWVMMPRATRPCFRYKKHSRTFPLSITRPLARAVILSDGGTLERRLLDDGARAWPVQAEIDLYEALPGTQLGHVAAFEADASAEEAADAAGEFEELTPEAAALLTGEAGLGRRTAGARALVMAGSRRRPPLRPGRRFYRIRVHGRRRRRRWRRFGVYVDTAAAKPTLRVHVRLSERGANEMAEQLARRAHVQVVAAVRELLGPACRKLLAGRIMRVVGRALGTQVAAERATALATHVAEAMVATVAKQLPTAAATLAQAARDPASGVTLTFTFAFADREALATGTPDAPTMTVRAGHHRD
jgi:hypothetical protein